MCMSSLMGGDMINSNILMMRKGFNISLMG